MRPNKLDIPEVVLQNLPHGCALTRRDIARKPVHFSLLDSTPARSRTTRVFSGRKAGAHAYACVASCVIMRGRSIRGFLFSYPSR